MTRINPAPAILLLACGTLSSSAFAEDKLTWTYPCQFSYNRLFKKDPKIEKYRCDFIHRKYDDSGVDDFNGFDPGQQQLELNEMLAAADAAKRKYDASIGPILARTDPAQLPQGLASQERLKRLMELDSAFIDSVFKSSSAVCAPFLWEPYKDSYAVKNPGLPASWSPYVEPFQKRWDELNDLIAPAQERVLQETDARLKTGISLADSALSGWNNIKKIANGLQGNGAKATLDGLYDSRNVTGTDAGGIATSGFARRDAIVSAENFQLPSAHKTGLRPPSDLQIPEPPAPTASPGRREWTDRNYFTRGYAEGMQRLHDDAKIAFWHEFGWTRTIGDPDGKAGLIFQQMGGSCAIGAQCLALWAHGREVEMPDLIREAKILGVYSEIHTRGSVMVGGTNVENITKLLEKHHVPASIKQNAKLEDLDAALRKGGHHDAILTVDAKPLWNDASLPANSGHVIYVTGMEVDNKSGGVLGYYIDDTGTGEGARFVPSEDLKRSVAGLAGNSLLVSFNDAGAAAANHADDREPPSPGSPE